MTDVINRETRPEFSEIDPRKKGKETFLSKRIYSILFVNLKKTKEQSLRCKKLSFSSRSKYAKMSVDFLKKIFNAKQNISEC